MIVPIGARRQLLFFFSVYIQGFTLHVNGLLVKSVSVEFNGSKLCSLMRTVLRIVSCADDVQGAPKTAATAAQTRDHNSVKS